MPPLNRGEWCKGQSRGFAMPLHQNITDDFSLGVREAEISPSMPVGEFFAPLPSPPKVRPGRLGDSQSSRDF
ncbi:MAG: hypothetical protein EBR81_14300 [Proteobacteria bacterium]|nr:hypothetical protein [Pseudomonadota bacterium]